MGALLKAVEDGAEPANGARANLDSLALCFAAVAGRAGGAGVGPAPAGVREEMP